MLTKLLHIGCTEGEIRLAGGSDEMEGRIEICLSNEWGTVCDQRWDDTDAGVVCRQLQLQSIGNYFYMYLYNYYSYVNL